MREFRNPFGCHGASQPHSDQGGVFDIFFGLGIFYWHCEQHSKAYLNILSIMLNNIHIFNVDYPSKIY